MFTNTQIDTNALPQIDQVELHPIDKAYLKIIVINKLLVYGVIVLALILAKLFLVDVLIQSYFWLLAAAVGLLCLSNFMLALLAFKKRMYALRDKDVIYAHGLLIHRLTTVPISRIQHIETSRSWLSRQFGLATLNIYTAGESGSDLSIKGLSEAEATRINDFLSTTVNGGS
ncbi:PH domain-containing protein [Subsaximicrobium wynnwilliamsii]|uniref:PH domain-containing protein n=1 Tax=Subsaximicrobium wynnwilliamsii TaxID=291179 RepID=A0A5C6ZLW5_9FLAO|nr:PH domain-containing protein [Subsaximicrobium wynnwilliamsii]TXD85033.1 PH domain-containing protein [Subsaximicrobium wynnwilliamsii]TXD91076.1 PH domain-containing protein [Subsaximicrobium wynnwilliamsii]TXE04470.1 PH domain-containing protein [Subsaximicrobium wynnwilliamsii]